ncbi:MAG: immunoglobulin domain-containing protein [Phycisphaerales bacterium]
MKLRRTGTATAGLILLVAGTVAGVAGAQIDAAVASVAEEGSIVGQPHVGWMAVEETVDQIMARETGRTIRPDRPWNQNPPRPEPVLDPAAPLVSRWPLGQVSPPSYQDRSPQPVTLSFNAINMNECGGIYPADTMGDVSPTQVVVCLNGRIKVFSKTGVLGALNADTATFFASVTGNAFVADPRVVWDRITQRWFIVMITTSTPNRIVLAVSSGPEITGQSSFRFFGFQQDAVGGGTTDAGRLADYPSLGVDANGVYIGCNMFGGAFANTTAWVIRKSSVLNTGPIVVTAFRGLLPSATAAGIYAPRGVTNPNPAATTGYFIGSDNLTLGRLVLRRVTNADTTPVLGPNVNITVPATVRPVAVPALGSGVAVEVTNDRLFDARFYRDRLTGQWSLMTAHAIRVNSTGVASTSGDRDAARWYELRDLEATPNLVQAGTLVSAAPTASRDYYFYPTIALSGQGHMALGCAAAGPQRRLEVGVAGRYSSDALGEIRPATIAQTSTASYTNDTFRNRWGDYSSTIVDPADDMTMWTIQKYASATNLWQVKVFRLGAPGPATPISCSPSSIAPGTTADILVTGDTAGSTGFFDTEPGMNRISALVRGAGVTVNSVTFLSPSSVRLNVTAAPDAPLGTRAVEVANPDGQSASSAPLLLVGCEAPGVTVQPASIGRVCMNGSFSLEAVTTGSTAQTYLWSKDGSPVENGTERILNVTSANGSDEGEYTCTVTNACGQATSLGAVVSVCTGDFDCSGASDADDTILFFADWDAGLITADTDGSGSVDADDIVVFFRDWDQGC